ncbi:MAG TPA: hypothetical protein VK423_03065 [Thermoplasmata archaeon]|nr:hypothetical protein [Thermoplasmata archaeon]
MRHRSVALVTRDPGLYHELAGFLRERRVPTISLFPGDRIPDQVAVVLTSSAEAPLISHSNVLTVGESVDRGSLAAAVRHALVSADSAEAIIVGLDPGPRPGYSILAGSVVLGEGVLDSPESAGTLASHLRHRFPSRPVLFRVGRGDPPTRNRIVNQLLDHHRSVELVDEQGTTPRGHRRPRDAAAARIIAHSRGRLVREPLTLSFTPGEIANLQRLSREGSGGRLTISRSSAHRVLQGELSLAEAVAEAMDRSGRTERTRGAPPHREPL